MTPSRMALYVGIALIVVIISYYVLAKEPHPDRPVNLVHLLAKH